MILIRYQSVNLIQYSIFSELGVVVGWLFKRKALEKLQTPGAPEHKYDHRREVDLLTFWG